MTAGRFLDHRTRLFASRTIGTLLLLITVAAVASATPDLAITKSHVGDFQQVQHNVDYTIIVSNVGTTATSGTVTVVDTLPAGMTGASLSGTGWGCNNGQKKCTRNDALAAGASYPAITVEVNVNPNLGSPVTNVATVSGGGETNTSNDEADDVTTIIPLPDFTVTKSHTGNFVQGQEGATYTIHVSNVGGPSSGLVRVNDALPADLTATGFSGSGWTCQLSPLRCGRTDSLAGGASYPDLTLTVDVSPTAASVVTNTAVVSGGGEGNTANDTATDPTTIDPAPDMTITKTHVGDFTQGQVGAQYTITVTNSGTIATTAAVSVVDTVPAGLTATALDGPGWACVLGTLTCAREDALDPAGSYPPITVTVKVANDAPASLANVATVSGGGEAHTSNDTASDATTVAPAPDLTITKSHTGDFTQGQIGAQYTITVTNSGSIPTSAPVSVVEAPFAGLVVTAIDGTGWGCDLPTLTCTRADALDPAQSYPAITVTVQVATSAISGVNTATVSGGGEAATDNDVASDPTNVLCLPLVATAGGPQTICAAGASAGLGGNSPTIGTGTWSVVSGGTGTFSPNASAPDAVFTHTSGAGPIVLRWTVSNPPCPDAMADVTITITPAPTPATAGPVQTICALGTTSGLGGNTPTVGTGAWSVVSGGTGTFSPNASAPNATFTHVSGVGPVVLRWTISNPPCADSMADVAVTVNAAPTPATAGPAQAICELGSTSGLGGNTPTVGTGTWSVVSGGTGTFSPNANDPNAIFTNTSGAGPILLRWTISNPPCADSTADVTITLDAHPTPATVGADQAICALGTTSGLGGNAPSVGTGTWSVVSGGTGTFSPNANDPNAVFTHTGGVGPIVLRWTISSPPCADSTADVTVTVSACAPLALSVDASGNGVFEPGETVEVAPTWSNPGSAAIAFLGTASNFTGPTGPTYTIVDNVADYGSIPGGGSASCKTASGTCFHLSLSSPVSRPATHWDARVDETLNGGPTQTWVLHVGGSFTDVPASHIFYRFVETIVHNQITSGCVAGMFCPADAINRAQVAVFLVKSRYGLAYVPPTATGTVFGDVGASSFAAAFIEKLAADGVTTGCGNGNFCPDAPLTRAQMAVFLLREKFGSSYVPPPATGTVFGDVPAGSFAAAYIEQLNALGISGGCGGGDFCPMSSVTRGQMAVFLTTTYGLVLYGP